MTGTEKRKAVRRTVTLRVRPVIFNWHATRIFEILQARQKRRHHHVGDLAPARDARVGSKAQEGVVWGTRA